MKNSLLRRLLVLTVSLSMGAVILTGCGSSSDSAKYDAMPMAAKSAAADNGMGYYDYYEEEYAAEEALADGAVNESVEVQDTSRKLITTYNLTVETEAFNDFSAFLENKITEFGGYIQNLSEYNGSISNSYDSRYSYMTVRIPSNHAKEFLNLLGSNANITNQDMSVEDVTLNYVDTQSEKEAYVVEQERLMELLEEAETMEDILTIESRLSEVRYRIDSAESQLRTYDNLIDYTTFNISINEVKTYTEPEPETYGERMLSSIKEGLADTVEGLGDFFIWFVGALPGLIVFAIVVGVIVLIVIRIVKGSKKREAKRLMKKQAEQAQYAALRIQQANNSQSSQSTTPAQENSEK